MNAYLELAGTRARRLSAGTFLPLAIPLIAAFAIGAMTPWLAANLKFLLLAFAVIFLPIILIITSRYPAAAVCLLLAAQPLEAFEVQTPIGTLSPSILLLALLLLRHGRKFAEWNSKQDWVRLVPLLLLGWLISHLFRLDHDKSGTVIRSMITDSSFLAYTLLGICLAKERNILQFVAIGSATALITLGLLAIFASYHIIPAPERFTEARSILGVTSVVQRNYGLNVPWDAVALLVPLCAPLLVISMFSHELSVHARLLASVTFTILFLICAFVFQSRNMVLQLFLACIIAAAIMTKYRPVIIVVGIGIAAYLLPGFIHLDKISTDLRAASYAQVIDSVAYHPSNLIFGINENSFYYGVATKIGLLAAIEGTNDAVHDFFLSSLISMGFLSFLFLVSAYGLTFFVSIRNLVKKSPSFEYRVVFLAMCLAIFAVLVEPVRAGIVGSWLTLGLALGLPRDEGARDPTPSRDGAST